MEKKDYKHGKFQILTTSTDGFEYADYEEFCEINGIEPKGENSDDYYEWLADSARENYNCDLDNIRNCKQYQVRVVVTGTLGLWDGRHKVIPVVCNTVYDAIQRCVNGADDVDVWFNNGHIEVVARHHDGQNCFDIRALSAKGNDKYERANDNFRIADIEYTDKDFKRLPYLYAI